MVVVFVRFNGEINVDERYFGEKWVDVRYICGNYYGVYCYDIFCYWVVNWIIKSM